MTKKYNQYELENHIGKTLRFACTNLRTGEEEILNGVLMGVGKVLDMDMLAVRIYTEKEGYKITCAETIVSVDS